MKQVINFLMISLLILTISGCSLFGPEKEIVTVTKIVTPNIPLVERPKGVSLTKIRWHVVTEENMEQFVTDFKSKNGELVFIAMSVKGYENLSLNTAELYRIIKQQRGVIVYYETAITESKETDRND